MASEIQEIDYRIDKFEIAIEEQCIELIARHQPVGADLRFLIGVIKMNNDLERMGDHAVNIASYIAYLIEQPRIKSVSNIWSMAREVKEMLNETIRILLTYMLEQPEIIGSAIPLLLVAKNLERIADLSTNICEDVIYIAQARVIKHHAEEKEN
jgi:phosphate transport system protein